MLTVPNGMIRLILRIWRSEKFDFGDIPSSDFIMTTWRDGWSLAELSHEMFN